MPRRFTLVDYAGADGRIDLEKGLDLDPDRYGYMPKVDGSYVEIRTDSRGRVCSVLTREAREVIDLLKGFQDMAIGLPDSVLQGEAELWTEAAIAARDARGVPWVHLFDVSRFDGKYVAREPFLARRHLLRSWQARVEAGFGRREQRSSADRWHHHRTGDFVRPASENIARLPIVELARGRNAGRDMWRRHVEDQQGEGLVAVRLDAPMGAKRSKLKLKLGEFLDAVIVNRDKYAAVLAWKHGWFTTSCTGQKWAELKSGDVVEVMHNGWEDRRTRPRFPRIKRARPDLSALSVCPLWEAWPWEMGQSDTPRYRQ